MAAVVVAFALAVLSVIPAGNLLLLSLFRQPDSHDRRIMPRYRTIGPTRLPPYHPYIPIPIEYTLTFMANHARVRTPHGPSLLER